MCSVLVQNAGRDIQVLAEMVLADANTPAACEELLRKTYEWRRSGTVFIDVYSDASGYQRRTSGLETDWSMITDFFNGWRGDFSPSLRAPRKNPAVRDRVGAVNSKLSNAAGERRLFVDPKCRELIRDLEGVRWKTDQGGNMTFELDKSNRLRTHVSDALGYYVSQRFPLRLRAGFGIMDRWCDYQAVW